MSVEDRELSDYDGEPYELYRFVYGVTSADVAYYTTAPVVIRRAGQDYQPLAIERSEISLSPVMDDQQLDVTVPSSSAIAQQYLLYPPPIPVALTVWRGHFGEDPDTEVLIWNGRVLWSTENEDQTAKLECLTVYASLKATGLKRHYQYLCPYVLYDQDTCKASKSANRFPRTANQVNPQSIVVDSLGSTVNDPQLFGAIVEWDRNGTKESKTVRRAVSLGGGQVELFVIGSVVGLPVGGSLDIYRGCGRGLADCATFNNQINYGGQPFIPLDNPLNTTRIFV